MEGRGEAEGPIDRKVRCRPIADITANVLARTMPNEVERAIISYTQERTAENLGRLDRALVAGTFVVPVSREIAELGANRFDVPAVCIRQPDGSGALPAFTSMAQLLSWKPVGSKYVELAGVAIIEMAKGMPDVGEVAVNPAGVPRGSIPRSEFDRLLSL